jgi:hypothetical protein
LWVGLFYPSPFFVLGTKFERSDLLYWPRRKALGRLVGRVRGATVLVADGRRSRMGLIRTILALVILLILVHVGLRYVDIGQDTNVLTNAVYSLGVLVESPAQLLLNTITPLQQYLNPDSFYVVAITAAAVYFILYLLLGVGRRS